MSVQTVPLKAKKEGCFLANCSVPYNLRTGAKIKEQVLDPNLVRAVDRLFSQERISDSSNGKYVVGFFHTIGMYIGYLFIQHQHYDEQNT